MQNEEILRRIRAIDKDGALSPYIESNILEFDRNFPVLPGDVEILGWCMLAGLGPESEKEVLPLALRVREDRLLSFVYFHCSRLAYDLISLHSEVMKWPSFDTFFPEKSNLFLLLIALSAVPRIQRIHRALKVSPEITGDTCGDIASRVGISKEYKNGEIGVSLRCLNWLRLHVKGELFQFGRLQFHPVILNEPICVYRRLSGGEVLILLEPGQRFRPDGFYDGAGGKLRPDAWFSEWTEKNGRLTANRIACNGRAESLPTTIKLDEWRLCVDSSSAVMNTHIPRGRRITMEDWRDSIRRGFDFFRNVRPASAQPLACACKSWMFDPKLQELIPENSGLVSLQKRMNIFPLCSQETRCGFYFIFGDDNIDIEKAPRDTSLRRAVIDCVIKGGSLSGGGMLLFEDQIECLR
jgi:hypothetical protein